MCSPCNPTVTCDLMISPASGSTEIQDVVTKKAKEYKTLYTRNTGQSVV